MTFEVTPTLIAVIISGISTLVAVASGWGNVRAQLKSINQHLERSNGRLDHHDEQIEDQGQRVAHLEGILPHSGNR